METINSKRLFYFWAILGLAAVVGIWFLPWRFQTNDDEVMMWLVSGAYTGQPESYAVFIHPVLSWVFASLYTILPTIPWYPLIWFGGMFLGYACFLDLIWKKSSTHIQLHAWSLFLFAFLIHFTFFMQFSIVAALLTSAGLVARILNSRSQGSFFRLYWTDSLVLIGFLIRFEVSFLILAGILVLNLILRERKIWFAAILPMFILILCLGLTEVWFHQQKLDEFVSLNRLRSKVYDDPVLHLKKDIFKDDYPDLYYFANGLIDFHRDGLSTEKLVTWNKRLGQERLSLYHPNYLLKSFWTYLEHQWFFMALLFIFFLFSFLLFRIKSFYLFLALLLITAILSPFYLLKFQIYVILFLTFFSACLLARESTSPLNQNWFTSLSVLIFFGILIHINSFFASKNNLVSSEILAINLRNLKQEGYQRIYLIGSGEIIREYRFAKSLPFKFLGWHTFLEERMDSTAPIKTAYLVDENTFNGNKGYFDGLSSPKLIMEEYILVTEE